MCEQLPEIGEFTPDILDRTIPDVTGHIIGLGIDIVECQRVQRMLDSFGDRFLDRCFNPDEVKYCLSRPDKIPELAVRLAAKEASFKAIGARRGMGIGWKDFEVVMADDSVPFLKFNGRAKARGEEIGAGKLWMSLTHEEHWVAAVVIITRD